MDSAGGIDVFEAERGRLRGVAYRMLGVFADADDVVQDAWLRWSRTDRERIDNPAAWLTTTVTRLSLDRLRRRSREQQRYVGPWLPEPIVRDPADAAELADSLMFATLVLFETLTPDERAVILLVDVFGEPFDTAAVALGRTAGSCRQLAVRARRKLRRSDDARVVPAGAADPAIVERFVAAVATGDDAGAMACVHPDVILTSDGGPNRHAARHPIVGADRVVRFCQGIARRAADRWSISPVDVGGLPGYVFRSPDEPPIVIGFAARGSDRRIASVWSLLNPAKLTGLEGQDGSPPV